MIRYSLEYSCAEQLGCEWSATKPREIPLVATNEEEANKEAKALFDSEVAKANASLEALKKASGNSKIDDFGYKLRNPQLVRRSSF